MGDRQGLAEALEALAATAASAGTTAGCQRSAQLLGATQALRQAIGAPVPAIEQAEYEQLVSQMRGVLGSAEAGSAAAVGTAFQMAWKSGIALAGSAADKLVEQALSAPQGP